MSKLDFDFPSNQNIVEDKPANMVWLQWFQRVQSIVKRKAWSSFVGKRVLGTAYTNGTGYSIEISVRLTSTVATTAVIVTLGSGPVIIGSTAVNAGNGTWVYLTIPNGESYTVTISSGTGTIIDWNELR